MIKFGQLFGIHCVSEVVITPIQRPHLTIQSVVATGSVYKGQGHNQRELGTHAY